MFTSGKHTRKKSINRGCRLWGRQRNNLTIPTIGISPHVAGQFCPFSNIPDFRTVCLRVLTHEPSTSQCIEANNCAAAWFHSIVRLKELSAWHRFTYTQLYPLCWDRCFMTYSMSQRDGDSCRSLKYPSRCSIASTSFTCRAISGPTNSPKAIGGTRYWTRYCCGIRCSVLAGIRSEAIHVLCLARSCRRLDCRASLHTTPPSPADNSSACGPDDFVREPGLARSRLDHVTWTFAAVSWFPTIWYGTYVFWLANRVLPTRK